MKKLTQLFSKSYLVCVLVYLSLSNLKGQVITRVLTSDNQIEDYIPWYNPNEDVPIINAPFVDVEAVLLKDQQAGREMPRIGIKKEVNYTTEDGQLIEKGNYSLWLMELRSINAMSMNVKFENSRLPENAVMFLVNEETRFIVGPIENKNFKSGVFCSDYLNGSYVKIIVFIPETEIDTELSLNISSFDYGILEFDLFDSDFGNSKECNINVACEEGNGWECQSESVCKIIHSGIGACTGTLVNNECCDLTPYILTAAHCIFDFGNDNFRAVEDYIFRFNYQSPQCTPDGETTPAQWLVFNGAEVRSSWDGTDFGLVELISNPRGGMSFAGWDRQDVVPNNVTMIHHPRGDVKKISFDGNPVIDQAPLNYTDYSLLGGHTFRITMNEFLDGDFGVLEGGSSGCGYFNENNRLVSQHSGGSPDDCEDEFDKWSGRISESWEGNGTSDSRLRDWLGASMNPNTMDCMEHPVIVSNEQGVLCSDESATFTLINNMPCTKNVQWQINSNSLVSPTSGTGNTATILANSNAQGAATITYTLTSNGCDPIVLEKDFWVGPPEANLFYNSSNENLCVGETTQILVFPISGGGEIIGWWTTGALELTLVGNSTAYVKGIYHGLGTVYVNVRNECGVTTKSLHINVKRCEGGPFIDVTQKSVGSNSGGISEGINKIDKSVILYPNPLTNDLNVVLEDIDFDTEIIISIISLKGRVISVFKRKGNFHKMDLTDLPSGIYLLQCELEGKVYHHKISKI